MNILFELQPVVAKSSHDSNVLIIFDYSNVELLWSCIVHMIMKCYRPTTGSNSLVTNRKLAIVPCVTLITQFIIPDLSSSGYLMYMCERIRQTVRTFSSLRESIYADRSSESCICFSYVQKRFLLVMSWGSLR